MPLNEASGWRRSRLTTQQKREAEAAIYGLDPKPMDLSELTAQDIERMRAIVAQHDSQSGKVKTFDLNNPPQERYTYQPYPKAIYNHANGESKYVYSEEQLEAHLAGGWSRNPAPDPGDDPAPELDAASAAEAAQVQEQIQQLKTKKKS